MKFYSEILNKNFDSAKECTEAEEKYNREKKEKQEALDKAVEESNKTKKELSKVIESAETEVDEANSLYEVAKEKAQQIIKDANIKACDILNAAKEKVKEAEHKRYEAISNFNKKFGPYSTTLTGDKAANEYKKMLRGFDNIFTDLWSSFWRL